MEAKDRDETHDGSLRAAWVAYYFPPIGGAGTQRSLKFAASLPDFGVQPIVVTGPGGSHGRWAPKDATLADEVPDEIEVRRVDGPEPHESGDGWSGRRERWMLAQSRWDKWWRSGVASAIAGIGGLDLIHVSMSPFSTAQPAAAMSQRLDVPWIAGLRDPWALDEMMAYPSPLHRAVEKQRMRRTLRTASAIVMTTPEAAKRVIIEFPEIAGRVHSIPNGYDEADFAEPEPARDDEKFRIVHTGYLHTDSAHRGGTAAIRRLLGGEILGVDVSTRSHVYLLDAVRRLVAEEPNLADVIDIRLAGVVTDADRQAASDYPYVRFHGYVPHAESVALVRSADLLFLPMQKLREGERSGIVPGKTYEYLAAGRPILAAVPEGDARDIVRRAGTGLVCDPDDVVALAGTIREQINRWSNGAAPPQPNIDYVQRFERRALSAEMAAIARRAVEEWRGAPRPRLRV